MGERLEHRLDLLHVLSMTFKSTEAVLSPSRSASSKSSQPRQRTYLVLSELCDARRGGERLYYGLSRACHKCVVVGPSLPPPPFLIPGPGGLLVSIIIVVLAHGVAWGSLSRLLCVLGLCWAACAPPAIRIGARRLPMTSDELTLASVVRSLRYQHRPRACDAIARRCAAH